jgi:hypothetical protein
MPNRIDFKIGVFGRSTTVEPQVNGVAFSKLVADYETQSAFDPAGGYGGILPNGFRYGPLKDYFLGRSSSDFWTSLGGMYLLGCGDCGEVGCWPIVANVVASASEVSWSNFRQPHRPARDYSRLGPIIFDRA